MAPVLWLTVRGTRATAVGWGGAVLWGASAQTPLSLKQRQPQKTKHNAAGAGATSYGQECLDAWLVTQAQEPVTWDVIQFNFGLV